MKPVQCTRQKISRKLSCRIAISAIAMRGPAKAPTVSRVCLKPHAAPRKRRAPSRPPWRTAQVTEAIFDSPTGRLKPVPQGAQLIVVYDSQIAFGQSRVLLVWTRLIMPNGRPIMLERQQGADASGYSGLEDEVDNHWKELLGAAALSTLLGVGSELGSVADNGSNIALLQALRLVAANSVTKPDSRWFAATSIFNLH